MLAPTLRAKTAALGAIVAAMLALVASLSTYGLSRRYMVEQRSNSSVTQVLVASRLSLSLLGTDVDQSEVLARGARVLPGERAALFTDGEWFVSGVGLSTSDLPPSLLRALADGNAARQRTVIRSEPVVVVGIPLTDEEGTWFVGVVSLRELSRTLSILRRALSVGVLLSALGGILVGWRLSSRVMEPLHVIGDTAEAIARGDLERRVAEPTEPDLARIARAFNGMTESLKVRIEREARFGATVSHELKSPLTVIKGAAELISARRAELPPRVQEGSDLLEVQIGQFETILDDLIEMSRYQSGTTEPRLEVLSVPLLVGALATRHGFPIDRISVQDAMVVVDVRRFEQVFVNLKRNADAYAGGLSAVRGVAEGDQYMLSFDDAGRGVPVAERETILGPFVRGARHSGIPGSGLGLAITEQHIQSMGGQLKVGESPEGGARFSVRLTVADQVELSPADGGDVT